IGSGAVDKPGGGRYVLAIGRVANRTKQDIDVDQLIKKIRVSLLNSKKVVVTTAVGASGAEDNMSRAVRDLADDEMFNAATVAQQGTAIAPEMSLSGKIVERDMKISSSKKRIEYIFQLSLTDIKTGLAFWEGEKTIGKIGKR
ncbi:MAG: penicillin-binding protein activator LpoB, partial [Kiritimatiellae bacterium]|nr:penicillin-binding protein activator LpoB [Kiritimatiellia bacterium]